MKRLGLVSGVIALSVACGRQLTCGPGTVERSGECVAAQPISTQCDPDAGDEVIDGICVPSTVPPLICGDGTTFDPASGKCKATAGTPTGCSAVCSAPNTATVCITGTVKDFVSETAIVDSAERSKLKIRVYDPIAFATNPTGTQPLAVTGIEDMGCFVADGVPRPSSGLVALAVDDADNTASGPDEFATMGVGAQLQPNKNVSGVIAFRLLNSQLDAWQAQIGAGLPAACNGLRGCGMWIGHYLDAMGMPVTNARPTRPGDDPAADNVFCFGADRMTLTAGDFTAGAGLCVISPDSLESHGGACGAGGCMCGSAPCSPQWPTATGGSTPGVVFYQPFTAM